MNTEVSKWLTDNYGTLKQMSRNITKNKYPDHEELLQDTIIYVGEYKFQDKLETMISKKQIKFFITRIMLNQYHSSSSYFHKTYRRYYCYDNMTPYITDSYQIEEPDAKTFNNVEMFDHIVSTLNTISNNKTDKRLDWYDVKLFLLYVTTDKSYTKLSSDTSIPRNSIHYTINKVKTVLKSEVEKQGLKLI